MTCVFRFFVLLATLGLPQCTMLISRYDDSASVKFDQWSKEARSISFHSTSLSSRDSFVDAGIASSSDRSFRVMAWSQSTLQTLYFFSVYKNGNWTHPSGIKDSVLNFGHTQQSYSKPIVLVSDNGSVAYIVWPVAFIGTQNSQFSLFVSEYRNGKWKHPKSATDALTFPGVFAIDFGAALSSSGNKLVIHWNDEQRIYTHQNVNGVWQHPSDTNDHLYYELFSFMIDTHLSTSDDLEHQILVWSEYNPIEIKLRNFYSLYENGSWSAPIQAAPESENAIGTFVSMSSDGNAWAMAWSLYDLPSSTPTKVQFMTYDSLDGLSQPLNGNDNIASGGLDLRVFVSDISIGNSIDDFVISMIRNDESTNLSCFFISSASVLYPPLDTSECFSLGYHTDTTISFNDASGDFYAIGGYKFITEEVRYLFFSLVPENIQVTQTSFPDSLGNVSFAVDKNFDGNNLSFASSRNGIFLYEMDAGVVSSNFDNPLMANLDSSPFLSVDNSQTEDFSVWALGNTTSAGQSLYLAASNNMNSFAFEVDDKIPMSSNTFVFVDAKASEINQVGHSTWMFFSNGGFKAYSAVFKDGTWTLPTNDLDHFSFSSGDSVVELKMDLSDDGSYAAYFWTQMDGGNLNLYRREWNDGVWTSPIDIDNYISFDGSLATSPSISIASNNNAALTWIQNGRIYLSERISGSWQDPNNAGDHLLDVQNAEAAQVFLSNDGNNLILVWIGADKKLYRLERVGTTWIGAPNGKLISTYSNAPVISFKVAQNFNSTEAVIVWTQRSTGSSGIYLQDKVNGQWRLPQVIKTDSIKASYTFDLDMINKADQAVISWAEEFKNGIYAMNRKEGQWSDSIKLHNLPAIRTLFSVNFKKVFGTELFMSELMTNEYTTHLDQLGIKVFETIPEP
jgi:hypothetical protein